MAFLLLGLGLTLAPLVIGWTVAHTTGSYGIGLLLFAGAFLIGAIVLLELGSRWQPHAVQQSGIFCYRGVVRGLRTAPEERW